jgi:hypothetical protein
MENHDGAIIESLIARDRAHWRTVVPEVHQFGPVVEKPKCSIIIPLYGRFDFLLNQMLEFSEDEQIKHGADLIYVIDDPRIASSVIQQAWLLYEANRVPFRLVVTTENRGYAGANNLGISVSRAPYLLLLNSDVIPVESGWLDKMLAAINRDPGIGIVGARLFYPNGSIRHDIPMGAGLERLPQQASAIRHGGIDRFGRRKKPSCGQRGLPSDPTLDL